MEQKNIQDINELYLFTYLFYIVGALGYSVLGQIIEINLIGNILFSQALLVIPSIVYVLYMKINISEFIRLKKIKISTTLLIIAFTFTIMPLLNLVSNLSLLVSKNMIAQTATGIVTENSLFIAVFIMGLVPAILEEFVYRGIFFHTYRQVNVRVGIVLSALLFALMHGNFNQFSYAFVMGIIFAVVIEATGSIVASITIHFIINSYSTILIKIQPFLLTLLEKYGGGVDSQVYEAEAVSKADLLSALPMMLLSTLIATPIACFILYCIAKRENRVFQLNAILKKSDKQSDSSKIKFFTLPLIIAIIIQVISML